MKEHQSIDDQGVCPADFNRFVGSYLTHLLESRSLSYLCQAVALGFKNRKENRTSTQRMADKHRRLCNLRAWNYFRPVLGCLAAFQALCWNDLGWSFFAANLGSMLGACWFVSRQVLKPRLFLESAANIISAKPIAAYADFLMPVHPGFALKV